MRLRREALAPRARAEADAAIAAGLDAQLRVLAPEVVGVYWPMLGEPELVDAYTRWHEAGLVVALPRVVGRDAPLAFSRWHPGAALAGGPFGTRQVEPHDPVAPQLLVLPCLGFDAQGFRLGYGGGFYDRTLATMAGVATIGVAYDDCEVTGFAPHVHDHPLDRIVTERRTLLPVRSGG